MKSGTDQPSHCDHADQCWFGIQSLPFEVQLCRCVYTCVSVWHLWLLAEWSTETITLIVLRQHELSWMLEHCMIVECAWTCVSRSAFVKTLNIARFDIIYIYSNLTIYTINCQLFDFCFSFVSFKARVCTIQQENYPLLFWPSELLNPFNSPLSGTTRVSRYQIGKTNLDFTEARDSEWQWHQLGHMQVCTSLQTGNHARTPPLSFTGRMPFLPPNQQRQTLKAVN